MASPWIDAVRSTGTLTIFRGKTAASWSSVFQDAVSKFNMLSQQLGCGVTYDITTTPPDLNSNAGANVNVDLALGHFSATWGGTTFPGDIVVGTMFGNTKIFKISTSANDADAKIAKAFIFCPGRPLISGKREASDKVKMLILVHEMIHAAGLSDLDHSVVADPDVFCAQLAPVGGQTRDDDQLIAGNSTNFTTRKVMPPLLIAQATAQKIAALWP